MKIKLMPMLAAMITLATVVTPFIAKAQAIPSRQSLLAQAQQHRDKWTQFNTSDLQERRSHPIGAKTRKEIQAIYTAKQREKLKTLKASRQGQNRQQWQQYQQATSN